MSEFTVLHISLDDLNQPDNCIHAHYKTKGSGHWSSDNTKTIESRLCIQQKSFVHVVPDDIFEKITVQWDKNQFLICESTSNITKTSTLVRTDVSRVDGVNCVTLRFLKSYGEASPSKYEKPTIRIEGNLNVEIEFWSQC